MAKFYRKARSSAQLQVIDFRLAQRFDKAQVVATGESLYCFGDSAEGGAGAVSVEVTYTR